MTRVLIAELVTSNHGVFLFRAQLKVRPTQSKRHLEMPTVKQIGGLFNPSIYEIRRLKSECPPVY